MKFTSGLIIYQYHVDFHPLLAGDNFVQNKVLHSAKSEIEDKLKLYLFSGQTLFTTTDMSEDLKINTMVGKNSYCISIDCATK